MKSIKKIRVSSDNGIISSFAIAEVTDILKEPLRKAVDFVLLSVKKAGKYIGNKANDFIPRGFRRRRVCRCLQAS